MKIRGAWILEFCHVKSAVEHGLQRAVRKRTAFADGFLARNLCGSTRPGAWRSAFGKGGSMDRGGRGGVAWLFRYTEIKG